MNRKLGVFVFLIGFFVVSLFVEGETKSVGAEHVYIEAGAPMNTDFTTWQSSDDETTGGGGRWFCNAALAVTKSGVLTDWELFVDNGGLAGEVAQLAVIRCTAGGGGDVGPALSGCTRVGLGPSQTISGDGLNAFNLTGSTQLDGASPDANGIVVQAGDYICANSNYYDIGVDCNGLSSPGGCPGPDFNTQYLVDLDTVLEPFTLSNSGSDGTLMIRAWGEGALPVGGIHIRVNKLELLAPYIGLTLLLAIAVVTVVCVKKRKRHTEIFS